jgi:hypothetical protein
MLVRQLAVDKNATGRGRVTHLVAGSGWYCSRKHVRVIDKRVDLSTLLNGACDRRFDARGVGDVHLHSKSATPVAFDCVLESLQFVKPPRR